ncbi:integrase catalytic domain-containing protein [Trichonephila clavipes]|nr:integrase catalytic domain-containing protein [Trichonephila clavipes]
MWTDSTIALAWIKTEPHKLKTFVSNRVAEIQALSKDYHWKHVSSKNNPADLISRGCNVDELLKNEMWFSGPDLQTDEYEDNQLFPDPSYRDELKCAVTLSMTECSSNFYDELFNVTNNFIKLIRIFSFIFRFINNIKVKESCNKEKYLTTDEVKRSTEFLAKIAQLSEFKAEIDALKKVKVFQKQGLVRQIRMQFWPINGKGIARKTVHDCIACFRQKPTGVDQLMGNLPSERVTPSAPFLNSGVDFCGPFQIKFKNQRKGIFSKVYVAIFVCLATKAIHLEAVTDVTTEAFIAALKRLCARRGRISTLMSDNATNFKGAAAELNRFIKLICNKNETLANYFASEAIQWKFIPPRSPNFGGLWEAGVKSFKHHLYRTLVNSKITFEEFETIIIQIEGILNSRPLVPLSDNINEYEVLTPGHFIIGRPISAIPEPAILDISDNRLSRWQYTTKCVQTIWKRWKNDYLNHLQQRNKWQFEKNNVTVGCLVLLKENDLPPCKWTMARILEVIYGTDVHTNIDETKTLEDITLSAFELRKDEGKKLSPEQARKINILLDRNEACLQPGGEHTPFIEHRFDTGDLPPIATYPYRMNPVKKQDSQKENFDRRRRKYYKPGDKVWVNIHPISRNNRSRKFMPKREGPYLILTSRSPVTYEIADPANPDQAI